MGPWGVDPWPTYVMQYMEKTYPNVEFYWENKSVSGRQTSWGGVEKIEERLLNDGYSDLVFIALGTNDRHEIEGNVVNGEQSKQNYISMIEKVCAKNPDAEIVFVIVARNFEIRGMEGFADGDVSDFIKAMLQVSDEYGIPVIDTGSGLYDACVEYAGKEDAMTVGWEKYVTDEVHVNEEGQKLYGDIVWSQLQMALDSEK